MKAMFDIFTQCAYQMKKALDWYNENDQAVDIKKISLSFTIDVIGAYAYGLKCNSFQNPNSEFIIHGQKLISIGSFIRNVKLFFKDYVPKCMQWLVRNIYDKKSVDFFVNLAKDTAKFRKANNIVRKDVFQLLLDLETELDIEDMDNKTSKSSNIIREMAAQVFMFFVTGSETPSATMTYCLYELATNLNIQQKLRDEIDEVLIKHGGKITYDAIMDMNYMSQVLDETLRKYPAVTFIGRKCAKEYKVPGDELVIEEKILTIISTLGLHHDSDYYPEPEKFDPERFSEENKEKQLPFTYLPFGEGPRICPASRYALTQIKVGLTVLLQRYIFSLNHKTVLPIQLNGDCFTLTPKTTILLDITKRNGNE